MPVIDKISLRGTTYDINDTGARANKVDNSVIALVETGSTASHAYAEGEYFIKDSAFCTAIDDINIGDTLTENTNYTAGQLIDSLGGDLSNYIQKSETAGLIKNDGTIDTNTYAQTSDIPDISGKADKVTNATSNNLAKLDAYGNLADSGYSANSFMRNIYLEQTATLSTSATTTITFSDSSITTTSVIDLAVSEWGLTPDDVTVTTGVCTVTMPKVDSAHSVTVRIYVR